MSHHCACSVRVANLERVCFHRSLSSSPMLRQTVSRVLSSPALLAFRPAQRLTRASAAAYHQNVVDHYENPRNVGSLDSKADNVGTGLVGAPACGDVMRLQIAVADDGTVTQAVFKTFGCGSAIASSSFATTYIKGKKVSEAEQVKNTDIAGHLNLPPVKLHCSMLAEDAIKAAVADWRKKQEKKQEVKQDA